MIISQLNSEIRQDSKKINTVELSKSKDFLLKPICLLDQNVYAYFGTRPIKLFLDLIDVLPIDSKDEHILEYSIKNNLTIVTGDVRFAVDILLSSRNVIFQTNSQERFYFRIKESKQIKIAKSNLSDDILGLFNIKNKKSYIADSINTSKSNDNILNPCEKIKQFHGLKDHVKLRIIIDYVKNSKSILVTSSKTNLLKSMFELNECVFVDDELNLNYISVEYFKFENVVYNRKKLAIRNYDGNSNDCLHDNIRFIRNYIDEIEKNLNFVECELLRRKSIEVSEETPTNLLSSDRKEINHE